MAGSTARSSDCERATSRELRGSVDEIVPASLYGFVWAASGWHQVALAAISTLLFTLGTIPLELNRRIINSATDGTSYRSIATLVILYFLCVLAEGGVKLFLNLYRNWIGERSVQTLRRSVFSPTPTAAIANTELEGVQIAILVAEAEPVGEFVGTAVSEPLLQLGILAAVIGYLLFLQPLMALLFVAVFCPQLGFVPAMQAAINRRVATKVSATRAVSAGIVTEGAAVDPDGLQDARIMRIFSLNMGIYKIKYTMNFLMNLLTQIGYTGIFAIGSYLVVTGRTEIGTITAFVAGLAKVNDPWGDLVDWHRSLKVTQIKYDMVRAVLSASADEPAARTP